ncbi:cadherin EGF LAG seven-pass G-type receptor 1 isoform X3 [Fundulus heteroclitus]|uniref:cadherin EGF LAG seven-pass G-type receptor 1 isoform X3 n=1 Tax=Fundulus heteroclitus TaxID=8078 RepID=UPI00165B214F|nr:cadherin EGF LAG seven-pass G-type receptor 1 isoform X3 [Fundulus heteroclitus]
MDSRNLSNQSSCVFFNSLSEDYRCVVILSVKRATGTFSLLGCVFMLFVIWLLRRYHSPAQKMILSLTVAAFFDSAAYVMGETHPEGSLCDFQAWWLTYFDWCALAWVCLITLNLYLNLVREMSTERFEKFYHLVAWGVPLVMASLPLLKGYYGPAGAWCWITDGHVAWRFGICSPGGEPSTPSERDERLHNASYPKDPSFPLTLLHVLSAPLHGLANAFVFGLDRDWWSLLSPTGLQLALQSRLCDRTRIGEYYPGAVRYTQAGLIDPSDDDDDNDTNVLFYSPDMTLKDRGP